jgi:hypothetical protein
MASDEEEITWNKEEAREWQVTPLTILTLL